MRTALTLVILVCAGTALARTDEAGHSKKGTAFDSGMRTKPWKMEGIGDTPFPITSSSAEVQDWFDQGNALLHSFWFEEAERSFRWCLKLDPECAMAYWGLARCGYNWFASGGKVGDDPKDRYRLFLAEAIKRKGKVTERERLYIEAWAAAFAPGTPKPNDVLRPALERIVLKFPDDVEAKALLAFHSIEGPGTSYATQGLIDKVLAKNPLHPGAHHASIHNWDYSNPTQALQSCEMYGKSAPAVGHALHMPGHAYSKMGMWHEAARSMDSATRTELRYMNQRLALPYETWNFPHNRNYLCYIQEQLGMAEASIRGAKDLLASPTDPAADNLEQGGYAEGRAALVRAYIKFERWDDILKPGSVLWGSGEDSQFERLAAEVIAHVGKDQVAEARAKMDDLKEATARLLAKNKEFEPYITPQLKTVEGLLLAAEGKPLEGLQGLLEASTKELYGGDPPFSPWPAIRLVGDLFMKRGDYRLAIEAYGKALEAEKNDGFSLAGLARAHASLGETTKAAEYAGKFLYVWSGADPGLRWVTEVHELKLGAKPIADVPAKERPYNQDELASYGPSNWEPFAAPKLECRDKDGKTVTLDQFKGKNVLLVFFLNEECIHCVEQLSKINGQIADFEKAGTVVLAVSSATPEVNKESLKLGSFGIQLLSDRDHENARRYSSYDDFEGMELHSTILIDAQGRVRWKRTGGDPFSNVDYLLRELGRITGDIAARNPTRIGSEAPR